MKRIFMIGIIGMVGYGLFLGGLVKPASAAPIKLLFASFTSDKSFMSDRIKAFAKDLEEKSQGRIKAEFSLGISSW